ncbi:MAG: carbohydrate-binding protein [Elusimicrobia bacterium]|nr:carbohydrate-binding protein [Elusimicrobiota bacterium]
MGKITRCCMMSIVLLVGLTAITQAIQQAYPAGVAWVIGTGTITIQAEDYDMVVDGSGSGEAYSDTTSGNSGNTYRASENVDVTATTDIGGGYKVGWTVTGEWMEYSINVNEGGQYKIVLRAGSGLTVTGCPIHIEFGTHKQTPYLLTTPTGVPPTGSYDTFTDVVLANSVTLTAGSQIMKLVLDDSATTGGGDFNYIQLIRISGDTSNIVNIPTISPGADTYEVSVNSVTLGCTTDGATTYYTLDGNNPTLTSTQYSAPFTLTSNTTVKARAFKAGMTDSSVNSVLYTITAAIVQLSYGNVPVGTPWSIGTGSTTIEFENYDTVASGSASGKGYNDTSPGNSGNAYRTTESVDIETSVNASGGFDVGWTKPGEWLEYSVNVNNTGDYKILIRVGSGLLVDGGPVHFEFGNHNETPYLVTASTRVPPTGDYQTYVDLLVSSDVVLTSGPQIMKFVMETNTAAGCGNLDCLKIISITPDTTPPVVSSTATISITGTSAVVTWTTNEPATSKVEYGLTTGYGSASPVTDSGGVTSHSVPITGLTEKTTYHCRVVTTDMSNNPTTTGDFTFTTIANDPDAPIISNVSAGVTVTSAVIIWTTNEVSDSQVVYGLTTALGSTTTLSATPVTSHSVELSNLDKGKTYYYRVYSRDPANNLAISAQYSFTTYNLKHRIYTYYYDEITTPASLKFKLQVFNIDENSIATDYAGTLTLTTKDSNGTVLDAVSSTLTEADLGEKNVSIAYHSNINTIELSGDTTATIVTKFTDMYAANLVGNKGGTIKGTNGIEIVVPAGVLSSDENLAAIPTSVPPAVGNTMEYANTVNPICYDFGELIFTNTVPVLQNQIFTRTVSIKIPYTAEDIGTLDEDGLRIYFWNGTDWDLVSGVQTVDKTNKTVTATVKHFSTYRILGSYVSTDLNTVKVYPNPYNPTTAINGMLKVINLPLNVKMKFYSVNGELIRELKEIDYGNLGWIVWDGKNDDGDKVGRGVYVYQLEDANGKKKTGKVGLVK